MKQCVNVCYSTLMPRRSALMLLPSAENVKPGKKVCLQGWSLRPGVVQLPAATVSASTTCELSPHVLHPSALCVLGAWACTSTAFFLWPEARPVTCGASRRCTSLPLAVANGSVRLGLGTDGANLRVGLRPIFPEGLGISGLYRVRRPAGRFASLSDTGLEPATYGLADRCSTN